MPPLPLPRRTPMGQVSQSKSRRPGRQHRKPKDDSALLLPKRQRLLRLRSKSLRARMKLSRRIRFRPTRNRSKRIGPAPCRFVRLSLVAAHRFTRLWAYHVPRLRPRRRRQSSHEHRHRRLLRLWPHQLHRAARFRLRRDRFQRRRLLALLGLARFFRVHVSLCRPACRHPRLTHRQDQLPAHPDPRRLPALVRGCP